MIDFCFKRRDGKFISIVSHMAKWAKKRKSVLLVFTKSNLKKAGKYFLQNCYVKLGKSMFRQILGISVGLDSSSIFANLLPHYYENRWIHQLRKSDIRPTIWFANVLQFIDDLTPDNNEEEFETSCKKIYPPELELQKENIDCSEGSSLDLGIKTLHKKFTIQLYDKIDDFPFSIVGKPYISKIFCFTFYSRETLNSSHYQ